jgi:hypothetical protein
MSAARARLAVVAAVAALVLTGCGSSEPKARDTPVTDPGKGATACRAQWKDLGEKTQDREGRKNPSGLAQRWNTVAATIDYYATSATEKDCGDRLASQEKAIAALSAFETTLAPYDVPLRLSKVTQQAQAYAARPGPTAQQLAKQKKLSPAQKAKLPPTPAAVAAALRAAQAQADTATSQQGPGWQQADVVDLGDSAAVAKAVKDLAFLSSESAAYRACDASLATIARVVSPTR